MDDQNRNLILATALSFLVILVWFVLFPPPEPVSDPNAVATTQQSATNVPAASESAASTQSAAPVQAEDAPRLKVETDRLSGSISLLGGRIDDLRLLDYREELKDDSANVTLLRPTGEHEAFYALFGWAPGGDLDFADVPGANTLWSVEGGTTLTTTSPVNLVWDNGKGIIFRRQISVDDDYMFSVTQSVENTTGSPIRLAANNEVVREGQPDNLTRLLVHEGAIRQSGEELKEISFLGGFMKYEGFDELGSDAAWGQYADVANVAGNGWLGFTDHYWLTALIPNPNDTFSAVVTWNETSDTYRTVARYPTMDIAAGQSIQIESRLFAGAKEWSVIKGYQDDSAVYRLTDSIDWGWYFFFTKPIFSLLHWLYSIIGNMGWAIIALTLVIKALVLPLAYKSYVSMARMKELQPEMEKLKERVGDDRQKMQQEMMALYKKEKVNPASGCLPILVQIPVFFSLYKVILVTLELRHAPWIGWIKDLSAPDPSSLMNLWGILPWAAPEPGSIMALIFIGILPLGLGVSMWLQQKLNPTPTDPTQAMVFAWMPWVFMFMLGSFASGLVIYWIANNVITFSQQYIIMSMHGKRPDLFGNIAGSFKRKSSSDK